MEHDPYNEHLDDMSWMFTLKYYDTWEQIEACPDYQHSLSNLIGFASRDYGRTNETQ